VTTEGSPLWGSIQRGHRHSQATAQVHAQLGSREVESTLSQGSLPRLALQASGPNTISSYAAVAQTKDVPGVRRDASNGRPRFYLRDFPAGNDRPRPPTLQLTCANELLATSNSGLGALGQSPPQSGHQHHRGFAALRAPF
jgi:hypothetical protein